MGTEKYPVENEFDKFVQKHGGNYNAYTSGEHTNYHFDITPGNLESGLDRFSQFFIAPLFTESAVEREVNAVNNEHAKNVPDDQWRLLQLRKALSASDHDYNRFSTGSKATLWDGPKCKGIDIRGELLKFHER